MADCFQTARGRDGDDRVPPFRGAGSGLRLRIRARQERRIRFEWCAGPVRILGEGGRATGVLFQRTELLEPATREQPGARNSGSEFVLAADMVVKALGTGASARPGLGRAGPANRRGAIVVDRATLMTAFLGSSPAATACATAARSLTPCRTGKLRRKEFMVLSPSDRPLEGAPGPCPT